MAEPGFSAGLRQAIEVTPKVIRESKRKRVRERFRLDTCEVYPFPGLAMCDAFDSMNSIFRSLTVRRPVLDCAMPTISGNGYSAALLDEQWMRKVYQFTNRTMST